LPSKPSSKTKKAKPLKRSSSFDELMGNLTLVVDAIGRFFGKHCEVVLHDLRHPERSVVAIANGSVTGRKNGSPLIAAPLQDKGIKALLESSRTSSEITSNYTSRTRDGRTLRSTSVIFRDSKGKPKAGLCINLDLTEFSIAAKLLGAICGDHQDTERMASGIDTKKEQSLPEHMALTIKGVIDDAVSSILQAVYRAKKSYKIEALKIMRERGLFLMKGGIEYAAGALGVSRFTIYNYLKELELLGKSNRYFMPDHRAGR
jgi:predicted transcriptional regulator YheO